MSDEQVGACKHGKALHYRYPCDECLAERGLTRDEYFAIMEKAQEEWAETMRQIQWPQ